MPTVATAAGAEVRKNAVDDLRRPAGHRDGAVMSAETISLARVSSPGRGDPDAGREVDHVEGVVIRSRQDVVCDLSGQFGRDVAVEHGGGPTMGWRDRGG